MEEGSEELMRAVHDGPPLGLPPSPQTHPDRVNGDSRHQQTHDGQDGDLVSPSGSRSPPGDALRDLDGDDEQEEADPAVPLAAGDDEFESFHRSFTVGANTVNSVGAMPSFPDSDDTPDHAIQRVAGQASQAEPVPPVAAQGVVQEQDPQPPSTPTPAEEVKEDPTVVQARRSMMARTGDRHARGKLPEPTDGRFLPPDCPPLEPQMPASRSSKRYMNNKKRCPDVFEGTVREDDEPGDEEHVVSCRGCNLDLVVRKAAVVVRCKNCGKVNPASSVERFDGFTSR